MFILNKFYFFDNQKILYILIFIFFIDLFYLKFLKYDGAVEYIKIIKNIYNFDIYENKKFPYIFIFFLKILKY